MADPQTTVSETRCIALKQAGQAADIARTAFANGDLVVGIAAICLASQLLQLARIWETIETA